MDILYLLIPLGMVFVVLVAFALFWAIRSGQYEDMEGPAHRILMDDDDPMIPGNDEVSRPDPERADDGPRPDESGNGPDSPAR